MGCSESKASPDGPTDGKNSGGAAAGTKPKGGFSDPSQTVDKLQTAATQGARNVRNVFAKPIAEEEMSNYKPPVHPKTEEEKKFIRTALKHNFVFEHLHARELYPLIQAFEKTSVTSDEAIINQGDEGDYFYIIKNGSCAFSVDGKQVGKAGKGDSFGELALMYTSPRAATVTALLDTELFRVDQKTFRYILQTQTQQGTHEKRKLLKGVPFLKELSEEDIGKLAHAMTPKVFEKEEYLMRKGDVGDYFYILQEGTVKATDVGLGDNKYEDVTFKAGDYVGERALVTGDPRAANVIAQTDGMAFGIDRDTFELVLGNLKEVVLRAQDKRKLCGIKIIADSGLDAPVLNALADLFTDKKFKAGDTVFTEGKSTPAALYLVREGKVDITTESNSRTEHITTGGYFGDEQLKADVKTGKNGPKDPTNAEAEYTAKVLEDCVCGVLTLKDVRTVLDTRSLGQKTVIKPQNLRESIVTSDIKYESLKRHTLLGAGTFGQVWLVSREASDGTRKAYALKVQAKHELVQDGQAKAVVQEKNIMSKMQHPFIINLVNTYQDETFVYMLLGLVQGGELYSVIHSSRRDGVPEKDAKFYAAGVAEGLAYMHRRGFVYRDLKPENVLIDDKGFPVIVDFGFAKHVTDKTYTLCGTPLYLPPEVILNRGHNWSADHWSLGVLIFEMISGDTPFYVDGMEQMDLFRSIVKCKYDIPRSFSKQAGNIVHGFLTKDPTQRLGSLKGGEGDVLGHPWFADIDFHVLTSRDFPAPFVPKIKDPLDASNFEDWSHLDDKTKKDYPKLTAEQAKIFAKF